MVRWARSLPDLFAFVQPPFTSGLAGEIVGASVDACLIRKASVWQAFPPPIPLRQRHFALLLTRNGSVCMRWTGQEWKLLSPSIHAHHACVVVHLQSVPDRCTRTVLSTVRSTLSCTRGVVVLLREPALSGARTQHTGPVRVGLAASYCDTGDGLAFCTKPKRERRDPMRARDPMLCMAASTIIATVG